MSPSLPLQGLLDDSQLQQNMEDDHSPGGGGEPANDTLNAIGALIQMQQSAGGSPSQSQLILTRSSSEAEPGQPSSSTCVYTFVLSSYSIFPSVR